MKKKDKPEKNGKATNGQTNGSLSHDDKVEEMINRFTQKRQENDVDKYFRALVKLQGSEGSDHSCRRYAQADEPRAD